MDPLSIAAAVVGLLGATATVKTILTNIIRGINYTPKLTNGVLQEVSDINACLTQLQVFLLEQVVVTLTACVMTMSELEEILESLNKSTPTGFISRIAWIRKEPTLASLSLRLSSSRQSLNLMLTTITCASVDQATTSVETLTSVVQNLLQNNQYLCRRIDRLESLPSDQTIKKAASLTENQGEDEDDASTIRPKQQATDPILKASEPAATAVKRFTFEQDLRHSKVYRRARRRMSRDSLHSSAAPSFGWSCLSETSLADVSNVSVISLPISANELANAQHYALSSIRLPGLNEENYSIRDYPYVYGGSLPSKPTPVLAGGWDREDIGATKLRIGCVEHKIAILGQQFFHIRFLDVDRAMTKVMSLLVESQHRGIVGGLGFTILTCYCQARSGDGLYSVINLRITGRVNRPLRGLILIGSRDSGTSLSGKTTIHKQFSALCGYKFTEDEREEVLARILENLISASLLVCHKIKDSGIQASNEARKCLDILDSFHLKFIDESWDKNLPQDFIVRYVRAFRELLCNSDIRRLLRSEDKAGLHDNIEYLSSRCESLFVETGTVAHIDLFHSRSESTPRLCRSKYLLGSVRYSVTDVGGTPSERIRDWRRAYFKADYIIYTVALSGYCRRLPDHNDLNQMRDAMSAFEDIALSVSVPIILLFTKKDVFEENLEVQPFSDFFPDYTGMMDSSSICVYIATMFRRLHARPNGQLYTHFVNAADPHNFKRVFRDIESDMLKPVWPTHFVKPLPVLPKDFVRNCSPWDEPHLPHETSSSTTIPSEAASDTDSDTDSELLYKHSGATFLLDSH